MRLAAHGRLIDLLPAEISAALRIIIPLIIGLVLHRALVDDLLLELDVRPLVEELALDLLLESACGDPRRRGRKQEHSDDRSEKPMPFHTPPLSVTPMRGHIARIFLSTSARRWRLR